MIPVFVLFAETIQLLPDGSILFHVVLILLMIFVLNRTLFKPVISVLNARDGLTHGRSEEAKLIARDVEQSLSQYERSLREARVETYHAVEKLRGEAMQVRQSQINSVRDELAEMVSSEKKAIHDQSREAWSSLEDEARRVAASVSSRILGRSIGSS